MSNIIDTVKANIDPATYYHNRLEAMPSIRPDSKGWTDGGLCPHHADTNPGSWRVNIKTGGYRCFSCGASGGDIIDHEAALTGLKPVEAARNLAEEFHVHLDDPRPRQYKATPAPAAKVAKAPTEKKAKRDPDEKPKLRWTWPYKDRTEQIIGKVDRLNYTDGGKTFLPRFILDGNGYKAGYATGLRPLYGMDTLSRGGIVYITEGEKAATACHYIGLACVTSPGGSNQPHCADWTPLDGVGRVVLLADNDEPGEKYIRDVARILEALPDPPDVFRVNLPDLPPTGDAADWLAKHIKGWDGFSSIMASEERLAEIRAEFESYPLRPLEVAQVEVVDPPIPLDDGEEENTFPLHALGPVLSGAVEATHHATQAPVSVCANSALGAVSLACQSYADVQFGNKIVRPISLFVATVGPSGIRKSSADGLALAPIRKFEEELRKTQRDEWKAYKEDKRVWDELMRRAKGGGRNGNKPVDAESLRKAIQAAGPEPIPPRSPVRTIGDCTVEGMMTALEERHPSQGLMTDEAGVLIGGHAMNKDNNVKTIATLSSAWDGTPINRLRRGDGLTQLAGRRLTVHLMAQPEVVALMLDNPLTQSQGILSRLLMAWPKSNIGYRPFRAFDIDADPRYIDYCQRVYSLMQGDDKFIKHGEIKPPVYNIEGEAAALWEAFYNDVESRSAPDGDLRPIHALAAKAGEHAARLAAVFAVFEDARITPERMQRAIEIINFYLREALRVTGQNRDSVQRERLARLLAWMKTRNGDIRVRDIQAGLREFRRLKAQDIAAMLAELEELGHVESVPSLKNTYRVRRAAA